MHVFQSSVFQHALSLPGFAFMYSDIIKHAAIFNQSTPMQVPVLGGEVPEMWLYLVGASLGQLVV